LTEAGLIRKLLQFKEQKMENDVLYKRLRPQKLSAVIGQDAAVQTIKQFGKRKQVPHCLLFNGPSGCGKTTLCRILRGLINCSDVDCTEVNAATANGIDMVRDIQKRCRLAPLQGACRVWIIDECHQLTTQAQNAFLKLLEDTPEHVYFMLATTDPKKLLKTVRSRATEITLKPVPRKTISKYLTEAVRGTYGSGACPEEQVLEAIAEASEGGVRKALVLLDQVIGLSGTEAQLAAVSGADAQAVGIDLCRQLLNTNTPWSAVAKTLKELQEDPEAVRHMVLGYARSVLLGNNKKMIHKAADIIHAFSDNFYDSKKAGLAMACYEVKHAK
jgi:DNA polymerase-3 subunit gamma/tau